MHNKPLSILLAVVIVFLLIVGVFALRSCAHRTPAPPSATEAPFPEAPLPPEPTQYWDAAQPPSESTENTASQLTVHYIDVGQADSILLECDGEFMLIDGGNVGDGSLVVSYLWDQGVEELDYLICTHAHEDHVGGLSAVLENFPVGILYCPVRSYASQWFSDFTKYARAQDLPITVPEPGDRFSLGAARVTVLGPVKNYADPNNTSIVCRVVLGETSFLFTGDMEKTAETDLLESGAFLRSDVLKVGHHGSDTSTGYYFLREVDPMYAVISVGRGNDYGHPHEDPMSRLRHAGLTIFRTDLLGTVIAQSDGETVTFFWENRKALPEQAEYTGIYIGNINSRLVHDQDCRNLPREHNRVEFETLEEALAEGYTPCSGCLAG